MVLVPEESARHSDGNARQPPTQTGGNSTQTPDDNLTRLDSQMYEILRSKKFKDDYDKVKNYLQILWRYLYHKNKERSSAYGNINDASFNDEGQPPDETYDEFDNNEPAQPPPQQPAVDPHSASALLESIPMLYRKKAADVLNLLAGGAPNRVHWNEQGELIVDRKTIAGSNISDLMTNLLRKNALLVGKEASADSLPGEKEFSEILLISALRAGPYTITQPQKEIAKTLLASALKQSVGEVSTESLAPKQGKRKIDEAHDGVEKKKSKRDSQIVTRSFLKKNSWLTLGPF